MRSAGGVDLQDSFPAWLERAGIPSDIGSAARQQLRVRVFIGISLLCTCVNDVSAY